MYTSNYNIFLLSILYYFKIYNLAGDVANCYKVAGSCKNFLSLSSGQIDKHNKFSMQFASFIWYIPLD